MGPDPTRSKHAFDLQYIRVHPSLTLVFFDPDLMRFFLIQREKI